MKVVILSAAIEDLAEGFRFYEQQEQGIGAYFLDSLFSDIDSLRLYAGIHRKAFGFHRLLSKRFPYAIYYSIEDDVANVRGVLDCRRDPKSSRRRLKL